MHTTDLPRPLEYRGARRPVHPPEAKAGEMGSRPPSVRAARHAPPPPHARKQWVSSKSKTAIDGDSDQCFKHGSTYEAWQSVFPMPGHSVTATLPSRDVVLHCLCADRSQMPSSAPTENSLPLPQLGPVISQARDTPALCVGFREPLLCTRL